MAISSLQSMWRRKTNYWIGDETPAGVRKYAGTTAVISSVTAAIGLGWVLAGFFGGQPALYTSAYSILTGGLALFFLRRRAFATAGAVAGVQLMGTIVIAVVTWGVGLGLEHGLLVCAIAPLLMIPPPQRTIPVATALGSAIAYVAFVVVRPTGLGLTPIAPFEILRATNVMLIALAMLALGAVFRRQVETTEAALQHERERSEKLLRNVLPEVIAERLKSSPNPIADDFENVTILFSDIVGFTPLSQSVSAGELVAMLNDIFSRYDRIADELGVEKIKTIGDANMAVAGLPLANVDHASTMARMALRMREETRAFAAETGHLIEVRIGLHTGSVVAGVIGTRKFAYDLWGSAVNLAARMESHGAPGRIQITDDVRQALTGEAEVCARGLVDVKGVGPIETFWLESASSST